MIIHRYGFGGSGITRELKTWIWKNIPKGENIVELGAGLVSTRILSKRYNLISVEDNSEYVNLYPKVTYIYSKIDSAIQWYSLKPDEIAEKFKLLIIDGPSGSHLRRNILNCEWILERAEIIIVDDTQRESERLLAESLGIKFKVPVDFRGSFSVLRVNDLQ